jgi:hypothetical protein
MAQAPDVNARTIQDIRSQIEETRVEIGRTVGTIHARLSPRCIVKNATQTVRDATARRARHVAAAASSTTARLLKQSSRASRHAVNWARGNPVPMAVAGAGAAGLIMRALRRAKKS